MKKILIFGREGQVGWELRRTLAILGQVIAIDRDDVDISNASALRKTLRDINPDIIVNAAAYTAVDKAETDQELAIALNGHAPAILAEEAKRTNAILVHYSTDYVYNGSSQIPYKETDQTNPLNVYGHTKLLGDESIQSIGGRYLILRTSWVYGMRGHNFLLTMLKLAKERDHLRIVSDQIGAPTWSRLIAQSTSHILSYCLLQPHSDVWGTYHLTSGGQTSWHGFAETIFRNAKKNQPDFRVPTLEAIPSTAYPTPAKRPMNSVLSNDKITETFGIRMPHWEKALELCLESV